VCWADVVVVVDFISYCILLIPFLQDGINLEACKPFQKLPLFKRSFLKVVSNDPFRRSSEKHSSKHPSKLSRISSIVIVTPNSITTTESREKRKLAAVSKEKKIRAPGIVYDLQCKLLLSGLVWLGLR
jgi:hypothetical protein